VCVPHFNDPKDDATLLARSGADFVVRPKIPATLAAVEEFVDAIAGARFVLAGALHAAVVAAAYDVPFAFMDNGHVDIPFKWRDFAASINVNLQFAQNVDDGLHTYNTLTIQRLKKPKLLPILRVCPFFIRPSVIIRALVADGIATNIDVNPIIDSLVTSGIESDEYISSGHANVTAVREEARSALEWLARQASREDASLRAELNSARADAQYYGEMLRHLQAAVDQKNQQERTTQALLDEARRSAVQRIKAEEYQYSRELEEIRRQLQLAADQKDEARRSAEQQDYQHSLELAEMRRAVDSARAAAGRHEAQLAEQTAQFRRLLESRSWRYTGLFRSTLTWAGRQKFRLRLTARALRPGRAEERSAIARAVLRRMPVAARIRARIVRKTDTPRRADARTPEDPASVVPKPLVEALRRFGPVRVVSLPDFSQTDDSASEAGRMLGDMEGAAVVVFHGVLPAQLDAFFRLRLLQIARGEGPWPSLSFVMLRLGAAGARLPPGFANRAKSGWPFARAIFATAEPGARSQIEKLLDVPVYDLCDLPAENPALPEPFLSGARVGQPVAVQIQPLWGRCGSSTAFENQIESLVDRGDFVIRVFIDEHSRLGGTLASDLDRLFNENSLNTGAHVHALALLPDSRLLAAPAAREVDRFLQTIRAREICRITDRTAAEAALTAESVIVNHVLNIGFARRTCPRARLLLDVHDDFSAAAAQKMKDQPDAPGEDHAAELREMERIEGSLWRIADVCTNVNIAERERVAQHNERAVIVLPRPYVPPAINQQARYDWDALIVADQHHFNITSVRWFLDEVWRPDPAIRDLRIAIAGRADRHVDTAAYASEKLYFAGFVEDLDDLRRRSLVTLVPDRAGTGIAIKTLTALAAGHPIVSTDIGLRGLGDAVTSAIPGHPDAASLARDLRLLVANDKARAARAEAARNAYQAIRNGPGFAQCLSDLPTLSEDTLRQRDRLWQQISALLPPLPAPPPVPPADPAKGPVVVAPDSLHLYLERGWHPPEAWGQWMDGSTAAIIVPLAAAITMPIEFGFDVITRVPRVRLTIAVNGHSLPAVTITEGGHRIMLPEAGTGMTERLEIVLTVAETFCPSSCGESNDSRVLGLGLRSFFLAGLRTRS
jgi:hypothetical protein